MIVSKKSRNMLLTVGVLATMLLAACGNDPTPTATTGSGITSDATATAPAMTEITPTAGSGSVELVPPANAEELKSLSGSVAIDGSSTVYPITAAASEEFNQYAPNVRIPVGISGTGGGFKKFCVGETDIQDASRPISPSEVETCAQNKVEYIELPVAYDGLAVVVNPKNDWVDYLTIAELK